MVKKSQIIGLGRRGFLKALAVPAIGIASLFCLENCATNNMSGVHRARNSAIETSSQYNNFKRDMNKGVELSLEGSVRDVEQSGGYFFVPKPNFFYNPKEKFFADVPNNGRYIPIYLDSKGVHVPKIGDLEEGIATSMSYQVMENIPGLDGCMMDEDEIENGVDMNGYKVQFDTVKFKANSTLGKNDAKISVSIPAELYSGKKSSKRKVFIDEGEYNASVPTNCYDLWSTALEITDAQKDHKEMLSDDEITQLVDKHGVKSKRLEVNMSPGEIILYHLVKQSPSNHGDEVFTFAHDLRK